MDQSIEYDYKYYLANQSLNLYPLDIFKNDIVPYTFNSTQRKHFTMKSDLSGMHSESYHPPFSMDTLCLWNEDRHCSEGVTFIQGLKCNCCEQKCFLRLDNIYFNVPVWKQGKARIYYFPLPIFDPKDVQLHIEELYKTLIKCGWVCICCRYARKSLITSIQQELDGPNMPGLYQEAIESYQQHLSELARLTIHD